MQNAKVQVGSGVKIISSSSPSSEATPIQQGGKTFRVIAPSNNAIQGGKDTANFPSVFTSTYVDDLHLPDVHNFVMANLKRKIEALGELHTTLCNLKQKLDQPHTLLERGQIQKQIAKVMDEITLVESKEQEKAYLARALPLLEKYRSFENLSKKPVVFGSRQNSSTLLEDNEQIETKQRERIKVIEHFLEHARHFAELNVVRIVPASFTCNTCGFNLLNQAEEDSGAIVCPQCFTERRNFDHCGTVRDPEKVPLSNGKRGYDDRDTFLKAMHRYQGKQQNKVPNRLFEALDRYFVSFGMPKGDDIRDLPLNADGTKGNTSRKSMLKALQETGNSAYYEDVNLICHLYWGWTLPDISHLEDIIMQHYDATQRVYETLDKERKSSMNTQYRLFKHLQVVGFPCKEHEFKIVKTRETLEMHEQMWKKMCYETGLQFIPTL